MSKILSIVVEPNNDYRWKWQAILNPALNMQYSNINDWLTNTFGHGGRYSRWLHYYKEIYLFVHYDDAVMFQMAWG